MNALDILKRDHKEAMSMMEQLENSDEGTAHMREHMEMFNRLRDALELHEKMEEQIFYPVLRGYDETRELIERSYEAHRELDEHLAAMTGLAPSNGDFRDRLTKLKKSVQRHVDDEENKVFPRAETLLGEERLNEMGDQMMQIKQGRSATARPRNM
jgi:hemerythrin-like domain-containing protein